MRARNKPHGVIDLPFCGQASARYDQDGGPGEYLDLVEKHVIPALYRALDERRQLRWESFDREERVLRRRITPYRKEIPFILDDGGVRLELSEGDDSPRPWLPLLPSTSPSSAILACVGWTEGEPLFSWHYRLYPDSDLGAIEARWRFDGLPETWVREILGDVQEIECRIDFDKTCVLKRRVPERLDFQGSLTLGKDEDRPATRRFLMKLPLDLDATAAGLPEGSGQFEEKVTLTVRPEDFIARIHDLDTRLVAEEEDLDEKFEARILVEEEILLPDTIPKDSIPWLPWDLSVEKTDKRLERCRGEKDIFVVPWRLAPLQDRQPGTWREIQGWKGDPPGIGFSMGENEASETPSIHRIPNRQATVTWSLQSRSEHLLTLCIPRWLPAGYPQRRSLPIQRGGFDYVSEVRAHFNGLEERFTVGAGSELPAERLFLGPERWRSFDETGRAVPRVRALGYVDGYVRWEHRDKNAEDPDPPTRWCQGSAPILIVERQDSNVALNVSRWGGLYVPDGRLSDTIPWDHLQEMPPSIDESKGMLALRPDAEAKILWLSLWGFLSRYDLRQLSYRAVRGEQELSAWISDPGLPLFPDRSAFLLRSFSPIYAVKSRGRELSLDATSGTTARPALRIGRQLLTSEGLQTIDLGPETSLFSEVAEEGKWPSRFIRSGIPGHRHQMPAVGGNDTLWLLIEALPGRCAGPARFILSWEARRGWHFRGFFARPQEDFMLGNVRCAEAAGGEQTRSIAIAQSPSGLRFFLTLKDGIEWSRDAPKRIRESTSLRDEILDWEDTFGLRPENCPEELASYKIIPQPEGPGGERVLQFVEQDLSRTVDQVMGIRAWEPLPGTSSEVLTKIEARHLAGDEPSAPPGGGETPKKTLRKTSGDKSVVEKRSIDKSRPSF